jgi:transcriptional regulator with XRE-family HTH domain
MKNLGKHNEIRHGVGQRIRTLREQRGLSQYQFAKMIGMDRSYLINIEKGKRNVSIDMLTKIATGLDVWITDLFPSAPTPDQEAAGAVVLEFQSVDKD